MNNDTYYVVLEKTINDLTELHTRGMNIASNFIGESTSKDDLFFCASLDRCLKLTDGIILMLKERNMTCAGAILRLQMDNCMRTYAALIAEDQNRVVNCLIYGTPIRKEKDLNGNQMTDGYLKEKMDRLDSSFSRNYDQLSGYIHLSDAAFYQVVTEVDSDGLLTIQVGAELPEKRNDLLLSCAEAFSHYVLVHYQLLNEVVERKKMLVSPSAIKK